MGGGDESGGGEGEAPVVNFSMSQKAFHVGVGSGILHYILPGNEAPTYQVWVQMVKLFRKYQTNMISVQMVEQFKKYKTNSRF